MANEFKVVPKKAVVVPVDTVNKPDDPDLFDEVLVYRPPSQQTAQHPVPKPGEPVRDEVPPSAMPQMAVKVPKARK